MQRLLEEILRKVCRIVFLNTCQIILHALRTRESIRDVLNNSTLHNNGFGSHEGCEAVRNLIKMEQSMAAFVGKVFIIVLAVLHLLKELFQVTQVEQMEAMI